MRRNVVVGFTLTAFLMIASALATALAARPIDGYKYPKTENYARWVLSGEGTLAADSIKAAVDEFTKARFGDNPGTKVRDIVKAAKDEADRAAKLYPDDADKVKSAVKRKMEELLKKYGRNKELKGFIEDLITYLRRLRLWYVPPKQEEKPKERRSSEWSDQYPRSWGNTMFGLAIISEGTPIIPDVDMGAQLRQGFIENPVVFLDLTEKLGGTFVMGNFESQLPEIELQAKSVQWMPGLGFSLEPLRRLEVSFSGYYFQTEWRAEFPVSVFAYTSEPYTTTGNIQSDGKGMTVNLGLRYLTFDHAIQPYVEVGMRSLIEFTHESSAMLEGISMEMDFSPVESFIAPFGGVGIRANLGRSWFLQAGAVYARQQGGAVFAPSGLISAGVRF
jgi:hypothetical protein